MQCRTIGPSRKKVCHSETDRKLIRPRASSSLYVAEGTIQFLTQLSKEVLNCLLCVASRLMDQIPLGNHKANRGKACERLRFATECGKQVENEAMLAVALEAPCHLPTINSYTNVVGPPEGRKFTRLPTPIGQWPAMLLASKISK